MASRLVLGPLTGKLPKPRPYAVFDIEAKCAYPGEPINTKFLGAGFYDGTRYLHCKSVEELLRVCFSDRYRGYDIYAHNGSRYDFLFILEGIVKARIPFSGFQTGGRVFLTARGRSFLDSIAILRGSLKDLGEKLGLTHQKWGDLPEDFYERIEHYDWQAYLKADVFSLYEAIGVMKEAFTSLGCVLKPTLAGTALDLYRRQFLDRKIVAQPYNHPAEVCVRESYVGGRTEIFKNTMGAGASWDINSSYPYAMLKPVPTNFLGIYKTDQIPDCGFVKMSADIPHDDHIPPLHYRHGEKLYFPTGRLEGWYTALEAQHCIAKYGHKSIKITQAIAYEPDTIFDDYVNTLYQKRLQAKRDKNGPMDEACKTLLNSLYGKTGTNRTRKKLVAGRKWSMWPWDSPKDLSRLDRLTRWKDLKKVSLLKSVYSESLHIYGIPEFLESSAYILPGIASYITARGRLELQRYLDDAGKEAVYCDTDSIYRETDKPEQCYKNDLGKNLGQLKLEQLIKSAKFVLPKCYIVNLADGTKKGAAKGLPRKNLEAVEAYLAGEKVEVKQVSSILSSLRSQGSISPSSKIATKQLRETKHKRQKNSAFSVAMLEASTQ